MSVAERIAGHATAANPSGVVPMDLRVLVLPDSVEERTAGGVWLPPTTKDQEKHAQCKATVVAVGENAWREAARSGAFAKPAPGDRVLIAKHHGVTIKGKDGVEYKLLNDEDVTARLAE